VGLIFWPEFGKAREADATTLGVIFTASSVVLSTVGSLAASRNSNRGLPMWPALGFGMLYGAASSLIVVLTMGQPIVLPTAASWWISLLYLSLAGSVMTFACYLTLLEQVGPGPTGTIGVMSPLLALVVSMAFEHYRPDVLTFMGAALAVAGNVLMLRRDAAPAVPKGAVVPE
jgi:drug/metabolite transporter (DMT)-like permease